MSAPLAIVGISCIFPKAEDLKTFWANIQNGVDAITAIPATHWKPSDFFHADPKAPDLTYAQRGGFLPTVHFNPMEHGIAPKDIEATDTTQIFGLIAAKDALADAGYADKPFNRERTSVILGVTGALELVIPLGARLGHPLWRRALKAAGVADDVAEDVVQRIADGYVPWQENSFPGLLGNVAAGRIASRLDLGGTNCVVDAACASSLAALHLAAMELETGRSDLVITGGVDTFNDIFMYMCFSKTPALSPSGDAKPFDKQCDGTILGEGVGMIVLKRLADAERDGDRIYCVIKGIGSSSDGRGGAIYEPRSDGQQDALRRAYVAAEAGPETLDLIEAHGTGTKVGDATELRSLTEVFRAARPEGTWAALGSVKSQIGHAKAAAGIAGLIKAALALDHKVLPPTLKVTQPLDEAAPGRSPFYINTTKRPWLPHPHHARRAGVSAFGFGGTNFHCVLEEHGTARREVNWDGTVEIFALAAETRAELRAQLTGLPAELTWLDLRHRAHASRRSFRAQALFRLLLPIPAPAPATPATATAPAESNAATSPERVPLAPLRDAAIAMLDKDPARASWSLPNGTAFGSGPVRGRLAVLFPGQGSQYPGMFRDLSCQFPEMLDALAEADAVFARENAVAAARLSDFIYPHPAFSDEGRRTQEDALKATEVAQPALGAVSLGTLRVLRRFGIEPAAAAGHSYGELPALHTAGRLATDALHTLSNVRGRLMASRNGHGDRGGMLAVIAPEQTVTEILVSSGGKLVIANRNSPRQFVLAGPHDAIQQAASELDRRSIRSRVLQVSAAFHSPLVADARGPFAAALKAIEFNAGRMPVYANATARAYPPDSAQTRDLLERQIVSRVDFIGQIETMHADGITTFLEVGPGRVLSDLVQAILPDREVETIAVDTSRGARSGTLDLAAALCRLAALGHPTDLSGWEIAPPPIASGKPAFTVPLSGANHRTPRPERPPAKPAPPVRATPATHASPDAAPTAQTQLSPDVANALHIAQQGMLSLQRLQEQTAQLHQQFLESQDAARRTLENLLGQRRALITGTSFEPEHGQPLPPSVLPPRTRLDSTESSPLSLSLSPSDGARESLRGATSDSLFSEHIPAYEKSSLSPFAGPSPRRSGSGRAGGERVGERGFLDRSDTAKAAHALLTVVAEKTGYPMEMLNLSMGLDSDLGVDSIKRVEIMAALRAHLPGAPEIKPEHLGSLQTLQQVVDFLSAESAGPAPANLAPASAASLGVATDTAAHALLAVVAEKTGYPVEMLNLDMGLDSDLGVDSIKRVEIMAALRGQLPGAPEIKPEHLGSLQTLRQVVEFLTAAAPGVAPGVAPGSTETSSGVAADTAAQALLAVVAEKTGYPVEMLNLDMGLDSDLGVDSIKRVEIMAALRGQLPGAPEIKPEHLGSLRTLREVVEFLCAKPTVAAVTHPPGESPNDDGNGDGLVATTRRQGVIAQQPNGGNEAIPTPLSRQILRSAPLVAPDDRRLLALPQGSVVWLTDDDSALGSFLTARLTQRGLTVRRGTPTALLAEAQTSPPSALILLWPEFVETSSSFELERGQSCPPLHPSTSPSQERGQSCPPPALHSREDATLVLAPAVAHLRHDQDRVATGADTFLKSAFALLQTAAPSLRASGRTSTGLLVSISRLDGQFGLGTMNDAADPVSGGLAGLIKTARLEWPEVHAKALDLDPNAAIGPELADVLLDEMFRAGPVEVGIHNGARFALQNETASTAGNAAPTWSPDEVIVVTGGARGVTATCILELARCHQPRLVLLGRTALTEAEPSWLEGLTSESAIKKALLAHPDGDRSPKRLEARFRELMAQREIRAHLTELRAAGSVVHYLALDVRDAAAVNTTLARIRTEHGPIGGLIHGAGVLADKLIEQKTAEQVDRVYDTKVHGLRHLLAATAEDNLRFIALFSSYSGRFGRTGQSDYAAANEVLNKMAQAESRRRPTCRVVSFNWGPWNGGMVTAGLRKIFEHEGVGLIEPEAGAAFFLRDLLAPPGEAVEILALAPAPNAASTPAPPDLGPAPSNSLFSPAFERDVSIRTLPCLHSHVMNGRPVLPAALMIEWLAHAAMHGNPGLTFHGLDRFRVLKGLVLDGQATAHVTVTAAPPIPHDGGLAVPVQFTSLNSKGRVTLHATADILLADTFPKAPSAPPAVELNGTIPGSVYGDGRLFHGPDFHAIETLEVCGPTLAAALVRPSPAPKQWISSPLRPAWLADPYALDAAFQLLILWSTAHRAAPSLPCALRTFRQFAPFPKTGGSRVIALITSAESAVALANLQFFDRQGGLLALAEGYEFVVDPALRDAFRQNRLPA